MYAVLVIVQVVIALAIIGLVLLQQGKGADMGAAFGAGASGTVFGASGSANFLSRTTAVLAALFFATSLALAYLVDKGDGKVVSVMDQRAATAAPANSEAAKAAGAKPAPEAQIPDDTSMPAKAAGADKAKPAKPQPAGKQPIQAPE